MSISIDTQLKKMKKRHDANMKYTLNCSHLNFEVIPKIDCHKLCVCLNKIRAEDSRCNSIYSIIRKCKSINQTDTTDPQKKRLEM